MTRSHYVFLLCALFSLPVHSGHVSFAQWVPWEFLSRELRNYELNLLEQRTALSLDLGEFQPQLRNLSLEVRGKVQDLYSRHQSLHAEAQGSLLLTLGSIRIDQVIQREFGGNIINIRIQATCSRTVIEIPDLSLVSAFSLERDDSLPLLRDFSVRIPAGSWKLSPIQCEGLNGIGEEIETSLNAALKNPASFMKEIHDWLAPQMNQWIRDQWVAIARGESWSDLRISAISDKGFTLHGEILLLSGDEVGLTEDLPQELTGNRPKFFISKAGYQALIQDRLRTFLPTQYDLRENASFRKLLNSSLMQIVAWPDLRRFHPATPFVLKNSPSSLKLSLGSNTSSLSGNGSLVTLIGGAPIDYVVYSMSVSVPLKIDLREGVLTFTTGKAQAKINWSFGALYKLLYKPANRIPLDVLTSALADLAAHQVISVELPHFQFGDKNYILSRFQAHQDLITMEWL